MTAQEFHDQLTDIGFEKTELDPSTLTFIRRRGRLKLNIERLADKVSTGQVTYEQILKELTKVTAMDDQGITEDNLIGIVEGYKKGHSTQIVDTEDSFRIN